MGLRNLFYTKRRKMEVQIQLWIAQGWTEMMGKTRTTADGDIVLDKSAVLPDPWVDYFELADGEYKRLGKAFKQRLPKEVAIKLYDSWFAIVGTDQQFEKHLGTIGRPKSRLKRLNDLRQEAKKRYAQPTKSQKVFGKKKKAAENRVTRLREWIQKPENLIPLKRGDFLNWLSDPSKKDPALWHDIALTMDPDGAEDIFSWIVAQKECHKGTAAYIFFINSFYNLDFTADPERQLYPQTLKLLRLIEKNWNNGFYQNDLAPVQFEKGVETIPSSISTSKNFDPDSKWMIPDDMFQNRERPPFFGRYRFDGQGVGLRHAHPELERDIKSSHQKN